MKLRFAKIFDLNNKQSNMSLVQRIFDKFATFKGNDCTFQWFQYHTRKNLSISMQSNFWNKQYETYLISKEVGGQGNVHFHVLARSTKPPVFRKVDNNEWIKTIVVLKNPIKGEGQFLIFLQHFKKYMVTLGDMEKEGLRDDVDRWVNDPSYIDEFLYSPFMAGCSDLWETHKKSEESRLYLHNQVRYCLKDIPGCLIPNVNVILGRGTKFYCCYERKMFL